MQRFGTENPHYIICMFFLLPQEASDFQSPMFHPHCTDTAPQAHLLDTIWRLKIITTGWLLRHPETSQIGAGHIDI